MLCMLNYDFRHRAEMDAGQCDEAKQLGLFPIEVYCFERPNEDDHDAKPTGVNFISYVSVVPRVGDEIALEDGKICVVTRITFQATKRGDSNFVTLWPVVFAKLTNRSIPVDRDDDNSPLEA